MCPPLCREREVPHKLPSLQRHQFASGQRRHCVFELHNHFRTLHPNSKVHNELLPPFSASTQLFLLESSCRASHSATVSLFLYGRQATSTPLFPSAKRARRLMHSTQSIPIPLPHSKFPPIGTSAQHRDGTAALIRIQSVTCCEISIASGFSSHAEAERVSHNFPCLQLTHILHFYTLSAFTVFLLALLALINRQFTVRLIGS